MSARPETTDHVHSAAVEAAGEWLSRNPRERIGEPVVPALQARFGLSFRECVAAIEMANLLRRARAQ